MIINQNISALTSYNALTITNNALSKAIQKLSTGLRVNAAADDAAGLAISEKMRAQARGLEQAARNAQDGASMIQTAEGALGEVHSILQRMRELSVQAANDTLTSDDRTFIQLEVYQLIEEIDRISTTTQFNEKKLLDGSASAVWSSSDSATAAIIRGGLNGNAGNYKIDVTTMAGKGQVQKSSLFKTQEAFFWALPPDSFSGWKKVSTQILDATHEQTYLNDGATLGTQGGGCAHIYIEDIHGSMVDGSYHISFPNQISSAQAQVAAAYGMDATDIAIEPSFPDGTYNSNILFEAVAIHGDAEAITFKAISRRFDSRGFLLPDIETYITLSQNGIVGCDSSIGMITEGTAAEPQSGMYEFPADLDTSYYSFGVFSELGIDFNPEDLRLNKSFDQFQLGSKFLINIIAPDVHGSGAGIPVRIASPGGTQYLDYNMSSVLSGTQSGIIMPYIYLDQNTGDVAIGEIQTRFMGLNQQTFPHSPTYDFVVNADGTNITVTEPIDVHIDMIAETYAKEIVAQVRVGYDPAFVTNTGRNLFDGPQTIHIYQGDAQSTSLTLYPVQTMQEIARAINDAIASSLGQSAYADNLKNFCTVADGTEYTSESVRSRTEHNVSGDNNDDVVWSEYATLLIRSAVAGKDGELHFSGDDEFLRALGLATIQQSQENEHRVSISDAHSGQTIQSNEQITGNVMREAIGENVDVEFDTMANAHAVWNEKTKSYDLKKSDGMYTTFLHIAKGETILQIGANQSEEMNVSIGEISSRSLGLTGLLLTDRETAARAIATIDSAIGAVSACRARLGAYQNRLEHTVANLTVGGTNIKAAESRIRDADMAREMMAFTKLNILSQAGNSMLAQANQLPQNTLSLLK